MSPKAKKEMIEQLTGKDVERDKVNKLIQELKDLDKGINAPFNDKVPPIIVSANHLTEVAENDNTISKHSFITKIKPPEVILGKNTKIHDLPTPHDKKLMLKETKKESSHQYSYPGILNKEPNLYNTEMQVSVAVNNSLPKTQSAGV